MKLVYIEQKSPEWWALKVGKVSGTGFGQLISNRQNGLLFDLLEQRLNGYVEQDDYVSEDMDFGIEHEDEARELYTAMSGIEWQKVGAILSDFSDMHMASPDGVCNDKVLEIKCTQHGSKHIKRFFNGIDTEYLAQCVNYFAVSDDVNEVHFVSYCPFRPERPLVAVVLRRDTVIDTTKTDKEIEVTDKKGVTKTKTIKVETPVTIQDRVIYGRTRIREIESELNDMEQQFTF